ncbi:MAG: molybdate ABC transporter substrate-binding protein [Candidatus Firestonebacteria bacterium RIFOXYC2_FULL_39_67]|nr:MAG: molybdate ABC transporter substrate-binding protein [Candidatus Firestonebacteria bacterium RIFOXYD2_FULL_39_29]OGF53600.1 MAG: molybdate ABC transporter substrate-binding protein [Candidatus Firestonebacteria bacterium RifOxyC12_full_39_7]OGF56069.1 MAG: molybdate ABC transporter substrate-binding protein [Candidatus Firestonebacteria bacterium RIFOXYC2_FULL_39_67]
MRKILLPVIFCLILAGFGCARSNQKALFVYCGNTMRPAMELLAKSYEKKTGVKLEFSFGDSSEIFAQVKLSKKGDIFIVHEPYMEQFAKQDLILDYKDAAFLQPVLVVAANNPKNIEGFKDLAKKGMRLGWGEPEFSLAGKLTEEYLKKEKMYKELAINVKVKTRSSSELANAIKLGAIDAAFIWNASAKQFESTLKVIKLKNEIQGARVSIAVLKSSENLKEAEKFLSYAVSDEGKPAFTSSGYKTK